MASGPFNRPQNENADQTAPLINAIKRRVKPPANENVRQPAKPRPTAEIRTRQRNTPETAKARMNYDTSVNRLTRPAPTKPVVQEPNEQRRLNTKPGVKRLFG